MDVDLLKAIWNGVEMDMDPYVDPYVDFVAWISTLLSPIFIRLPIKAVRTTLQSLPFSVSFFFSFCGLRTVA